MKNLAIILLFLVACSSGKNLSYTDAIDRNNKKIESEGLRQDARFLVDAKSYSILLEQLAELATREGYSRVVSTYAGKMLQDHRSLNEQLMKVAEKQKIALPSKMSETHQQLFDNLKNTERREFDRVFAQTAERVYEDNIQMYKNVATTADNDEIRSFAASKLSLLRTNEQQADALEEEII